MQVTETLSEGLKRELKIVVPAQELNQRLDEKLNDLKGRVQLKGFRPGKVPLSHIKKMYGKSAMAEIINEVLSSETNKAISDRDEKTATQPDFEMTEDEAEAEKIVSGEADLEVKVKYEVIPPIEVKDMSSIKVERPVADVSDEEVEKQLKQIADGNRPFEEKTGKTIKAEDGDRAIISYVGRVDGEEFDGGKGDDIPLVIGSGQFIPGFEEQVEGMKVGQQKTIKVTFPEEYGARHLAGKEAEFDVTLNKVEAPGELALDDEFAKQLGMESIEKVRGSH
jgi:trigger factor